jgi:3-hydroxyisobutyrate dehydrogenase-like beta-hydroxyacid dehydrogenase
MGNADITVGCAGAGTLGSAIMERLLQQGFDIRVWNRSAGRLAPLTALGATAVDTPAALARDADFVLLCVTDGAAVEQTVFGEHGVASGAGADSLLIDTSTISVAHTRTLARQLREACGMGWLDAPISGGAPAARAGSMAMMVGGSEQDFARARPIWDALAGRATLMGEQGAGQSTKMINQVMVSCGFAVLAEACALAERAGVDPQRIPEALAGGRADSRLLQEFMGKMARSDFAVEGRIANMLKDLGMISDLAREVGAVMPVTGLVEQLHRKAVSDGRGDADISELVTFYRQTR